MSDSDSPGLDARAAAEQTAEEAAAEVASLRRRLDEMEARQAQLEENVSASSRPASTAQRTSSSRSPLRQLNLNTGGGPSAPPTRKQQQHRTIHTSFRTLAEIRSGIRGSKTKIHQLQAPRNLRDLPLHPVSYTPRPEEPVRSVRSASQGTATRRAQMLRLNLDLAYEHAFNQTQLNALYHHMMHNRDEFGVPASMTVEKLKRLCKTSFKNWRKAKRRSPEAAKKLQERTVRYARQDRKAASRSNAMDMGKHLRFADGTTLPFSVENVDGSASHGARADIDFACQRRCMSPEVDATEEKDNGEQRQIRIRVPVPWRSKELIRTLEDADEERDTNPLRHSRPGTDQEVETEDDLILPSSIRRWMVSEEWMMQNEDACRDVSDNVGPYEGPFAVASGPKAWGSAIGQAIGQGNMTPPPHRYTHRAEGFQRNISRTNGSGHNSVNRSQSFEPVQGSSRDRGVEGAAGMSAGRAEDFDDGVGGDADVQDLLDKEAGWGGEEGEGEE
ncbi:hypothetical protein CF326_g7641 [Tilletia indica]|nr:hypothetical protein CF326_g7641 [Tilletia indica]